MVDPPPTSGRGTLERENGIDSQCMHEPTSLLSEALCRTEGEAKLNCLSKHFLPVWISTLMLVERSVMQVRHQSEGKAIDRGDYSIIKQKLNTGTLSAPSMCAVLLRSDTHMCQRISVFAIRFLE